MVDGAVVTWSDEPVERKAGWGAECLDGEVVTGNTSEWTLTVASTVSVASLENSLD